MLLLVYHPLPHLALRFLVAQNALLLYSNNRRGYRLEVMNMIRVVTNGSIGETITTTCAAADFRPDSFVVLSADAYAQLCSAREPSSTAFIGINKQNRIAEHSFQKLGRTVYVAHFRNSDAEWSISFSELKPIGLRKVFFLVEDIGVRLTGESWEKAERYNFSISHFYEREYWKTDWNSIAAAESAPTR